MKDVEQKDERERKKERKKRASTGTERNMQIIKSIETMTYLSLLHSLKEVVTKRKCEYDHGRQSTPQPN